MEEDDAPKGPLSPQNIIQQLGLKGPEGVLAQAAMQQSAAQSQAQQAYAQSLQAREGALSQTGISPLDKASMFFQAAGALAAPTRSGSLMESIGSTGTALAGPLSKAAQADRDRQEKLAQLQMARQKLAADSAGTNMPIDKLAALLKSQRDQEAQDVETFKPQLVAPGKYALVGDAGTIKPIPADVLGTSAGAQPSGLTGEDLLKTADPRAAATVRAWINGDQPVPVPGSKAAERVQAELDLLKDVTADDPGAYNNISNGERVKTAKEFTPAGKSGLSIGFAAKALDHLAQFQDYSSKLENVQSPILTPQINAVKNAYDRSSGKSNYTDAVRQREFVMTELSKFLKGGTPAEAEIRRNLDSIDLNGSPQQIQSGIDNVKQLILGQVEPLIDQYKSVMGSRAGEIEDGRDYLRKKIPTASRALTHIEESPIKGSDRHIQLQQQRASGNAPAPDQAPAPTSVPHPQANAALNWVRAHPSDPRSAAILQRLGVQ